MFQIYDKCHIYCRYDAYLYLTSHKCVVLKKSCLFTVGGKYDWIDGNHSYVIYMAPANTIKSFTVL